MMGLIKARRRRNVLQCTRAYLANRVRCLLNLRCCCDCTRARVSNTCLERKRERERERELGARQNITLALESIDRREKARRGAQTACGSFACSVAAIFAGGVNLHDAARCQLQTATHSTGASISRGNRSRGSEAENNSREEEGEGIPLRRVPRDAYSRRVRGTSSLAHFSDHNARTRPSRNIP